MNHPTIWQTIDWQTAGFVALHLGAIVCAIATRIAADSRFEAFFHFLFLPSLAAIGIATWLGHSEALGIGIPSGITFMAMILVAVVDCRRTHDPAAAQHAGMHR